MNRRRRYRRWLWLILILLAQPAIAGRVQSLSSIRAAAVAAVRRQAPSDARLVASAEPLDARLRLAACASPLHASLAAGALRSGNSVEVRCAGPHPWALRVGVAVKLYRKVLVTTRPLARHDRIAPGDVARVEKDVARQGYGYVSSLGQVQGRAVRRPLRAGTVLAPGMLAHRQLVKRGDRVMLDAGSGMVQVRAAGVALDGGDRGDRVAVRSSSSGRTVQAQVTGAGTVQVLP